jgi:hypothetical protein
VIIHDFYGIKTCFFPNDADSILVINSYGVLSCPISGKQLEPVAWRNAQIKEFGCGIQLI